MISLIVVGIGAIVAVVGSGVLLARCFREPRGDLIAWSVVLLGLLVSLGSQAIGHLTGFDAAMFRAMELGGQVIAPLAAIVALAELTGRTVAVRFCARLYIPALAIVAIVILSLDQLSQATFSKAWPNPAVFYQLPPDYVLMYAIGPITTLVTVIAVGLLALRSSDPRWRAALPAGLLGAAAALLLAYPCLAQLASYQAHVHLPVTTAFGVACALAAVLTLLAGLRAERFDLAALHGGAGRARSRSGAGSLPDRQPKEQGYRDRENARYGWRDDGPSSGLDADWRGTDSGQRDGYPAPDYATGDFAPGDYDADYAGHGSQSGDYADRGRPAGDLAAGEFATGDFAPPDFTSADPAGERRRRAPGAPAAAAEPSQASLFGQIAIYTLLEERVAEFDQLTERVVAQVRSREPDTLVFIVHAVPSAPMQRILYEVYRDRDAYERHAQQPYVQQFAVDRRPYVLATNMIELGLQQAKVTPFPSVTELFGEPGYDTSGFERPDYLRDYGRTSAQPGGRREPA